MEEPPDPGGTVPPAGCFVTLSNSFEKLPSNDSAMDTDTSVTKKRKRTRLHKMCKHCNKRKREHGSNNESKKGCNCEESPVLSDNNISNLPSGAEPLVIDDVPVSDPVATSTPVAPSPNPSPPAPSSSTPFTPVTRAQYESTDNAPYIVHVQRLTESPNDSTTLHPIIFGKFLKRNAIYNIVNGSVKRIGRNRVSIAFSNHIDANAFIKHDSLNSNNLKAFIPTYNVSRMGVIRGVPTDLSPEEMMECTTVPSGCGKILKLRRINFKEIVNGAPVWKPTQTVVVTFDGQVLPNRIYMCYTALIVQLYTYPTIQCYNCCRFGHTKLQCRSKPRCFKCGREHSGDSCDIDEECISCCSCGGIHFATSKSCPEYTRQQKIKFSMAEKCISYAEASRIHPPLSRSYAEMLATAKDQNTQSEKAHKLNHVTPSSYRKTVFLTPRSPPKLAKGYDQKTHINLTSTPSPTLSNGCALNEGRTEDRQLNISDVIALLKSLIQSNTIEPSNAAKIIDIISILHSQSQWITPDPQFNGTAGV